MPENNPLSQPGLVRRRDVLCASVGAVAATAVTAAAAIVVNRVPEKVPTGAATEPSRHAPTNSLAADIQRELEEAKTRERNAREELAAAKQMEEGRKKAQALLGAPVWTAADLNGFLDSLAATELLSMKKSLKLVDEKATAQALKGGGQDHADIKKQLLWFSSNIFEYPFRSQNKIAYHDLAKWVATEAGVPEEIVNSQSTFVVERTLCEQFFVGIWDKLDQKKRRELLAKIDPNGSVKDHAALAALGGSAALAALSTTVYFAGFAFYTTMSLTIFTVAGWFGVTLPFAAYTGASSLVAFLTGPVGWAILAVAAVVGVGLAGRANVKETTAAIVQIHALKVAGLERAQHVPDDVFEAIGRRKKG